MNRDDVTIHHESDEAGVMIDFTLEGHRYFFVSDDVSDCGEPSIWRYASNRCRCAACTATWNEYQRELKERRTKAKPPAGADVCPTCGRLLQKRKHLHA